MLLRSQSLELVLVAYLAFLAFVFCILYFSAFFSLRFWSALVVALILSQVFLNVVQLPVSIDYWTDLDSSVCIYSLIQIATPFFVFVYALVMAFRDKRGEDF